MDVNTPDLRPGAGRDLTRPAGEALPWPSLVVLSAVTFVVVAGELLPTAVLGLMSEDLGVPVARIGLLVSTWAATVVLLSVPLVRLTLRLDRRRVVAGALAVFGLGNLATGLTDSYVLAMGSRLTAAAACGLLWATVNAHTAAITPDRRLARAVAVVLGGATLATVVAIPGVNAAAGVVGWRPLFATLAVLSLATAVAVLTVVVPAAPGRRTDAAPAGPAPRNALLGLVVLAGIGGILLAGHFSAFTFVTELFAATPAPGGVSGLLLVFGGASAAAVVLVGKVGDRRPTAALVLSAVAVAVSLVALVVRGATPAVDLALAAAWGLASGAVGPLVQTAIMRTAGERLRAAAGTAIPVAFNLGIAVGAAGGSGVVDRLGLDALPVFAGLVALGATVALLARAGLTARVGRPTAGGRSGRGGRPLRAVEQVPEPAGAARPRTEGCDALA
jgi:predicted MFS family arabinose efflux permease